jgi:pimeloyl-ACP methyl ester carboxylesterase
MEMLRTWECKTRKEVVVCEERIIVLLPASTPHLPLTLFSSFPFRIYDWFNDLARVLRVNIMAYDYTGYGKSNGTSCEENCYADIEAAFQYLLEVRKLQPEQIVLYGRSLGSGPSCYLASKTAQQGRSVGGVILQSPLLSAYRVAFNFRFTMIGDKVRPMLAKPILCVVWRIINS